jgi:hypothetical protein
VRSIRLLLVASTALLCSCIASLEPDVGEVAADVCKNEDSNPEVDVTFTVDILPKLRGGCSCHGPSESSGLNVSDYGLLRRGGNNSRESIVIPGDPCASIIYQKLSDSPPFGSRMPTGGPYWSRADMALLHDWIAEGASED